MIFALFQEDEMTSFSALLIEVILFLNAMLFLKTQSTQQTKSI